ncbi:XTP/dITP diphosphatase [Thermaerobacter subterraneus]|uniref:dITP/XTP pyrophosphatase n=1 Tax=Thermaerobacter subterraneus DSM 13965 TaxID=867903 RepID=K6PPQ9_9FIRM|nr:XTP/dITP diphosphatase [Thermaerobacter subterraneus]EKP94912.1 non-canonical purine NTP pyrophosphatase, rdgB/HAM1 family [Thermaerobacter subterraneus DSM 13965]
MQRHGKHPPAEGSGRAPARLVLATHNPGKVRELEELLEAAKLPVQVLTLDQVGPVRLPEETGSTFLENARLKAEAVARQAGLPALADDSGLCVDALGGRPGVHSARFAGPGATDAANNARLLAELAGVPPARRTARFRCVVVLALPGGRWTWAEGEAPGRILEAPRGQGGFGYDPLFYSDELGMTFAEAGAEAKNRVSHRSRALRALLPALRAWLAEGIVN